jgi:hypothetical protein
MADGAYALFNNTTGSDNTASGFEALRTNSTGVQNTASGFDALFSNTSGNNNTASGVDALYSNTAGHHNTAMGTGALLSDTIGSYNTATGNSSLYSNSSGTSNTATGDNALFSNTTGSFSVAIGEGALFYSTTGSNNTAIGYKALNINATGFGNIALGDSAGINLTTGNNNIDIGNKGVAGESKTIRIGKKGTHTATLIAGINGTTVAGGVGVLIDSNGRLGTITSSARFKDNIEPMDKASEAILALQPVTFRYKHELDPKGLPQFGLVAEQVEMVNPDLVARDEQGKPYTVRYEAVNAMLLNEFLKEHRKVEGHEATITQLKSTVAQQQKGIEILAASLKEQAAQIQKVSAQLEMSKPATRVVADHQ